MSFLDRLKTLLRIPKDVSEATELIYVKLPEPLEPFERGDRYGGPLDAELRLAGVGYVSGGGALLSAPNADGSRTIEYCGVDVDALDVPRALELLRRELPELGCLSGTELQYQLGAARLIDRFTGTGWATALPEEAPG
ncbi:MAG: hypothetical protein ACHP84_02885 [Caulobacterales bacterium]